MSSELDRLHMVGNAADMIDYFRGVGKVFPLGGEPVLPQDLLEVIESQFLGRKVLLGFTAMRDIVCQVEEVNIGAGHITLIDRIEMTPFGRYKIAEDPTPTVSPVHCDLIFDFVKVQE